MKQTILITGGTGYVGSWIVKGLLEAGHTVHLPVRNKDNTRKLEFLNEIQYKEDQLKIFEANLLASGSYDEAAKGADTIIHTASPFITNVKDAQKELIDPALLGTRNILETANQTDSVKRVVLTSSIVAVYGDAIDMYKQKLDVFNENHWNTTSTLKHQPYSYSKTLAEREAWRIYTAQDRWTMAVMNPVFVMGPVLSTNSSSESISLMRRMLNGDLSTGVPELYYGYVDVRDVAQAHIRAIDPAIPEERHILNGSVHHMWEMAQFLKSKYGKRFRLPRMKTPVFMAYMVGWAFGLSPKFVARNLGYPIKIDNSRSKKNLGMEYRSWEDTMVDMVESLDGR